MEYFSSPLEMVFTGKIIRLSAAAVLTTGLLACAATPTESPEAIAVAPDLGLPSASQAYASRDYQAAVAVFDEIISADAADANSRRLAQLGKALIFIGNDDELRNVENAKMALAAAGEVTADAEEEFAVETNMLMDAITGLISADTKLAELAARSSGAGRAVTRLEQERDGLIVEREELLAEQKALIEALEKLKELTLGD